MGNVRVSDMLGSGIRYDIVLCDHLRHNLYPPMPELAGMADQAIDALVADEPDRRVWLPDGNHITAQEAVAGLHLTEFVNHKREQES